MWTPASRPAPPCPSCPSPPLRLTGRGATTHTPLLQVLHRATELGITLFNTSDLYGPYKNEELLGALRWAPPPYCVLQDL